MSGWFRRKRVDELIERNDALIRDIENLKGERDRIEKERDRLEKELGRYEKEVGRLRNGQERLRKEIERLRQELEQAHRTAKRQAAPFSKGEPKADPKRSGRKAGAAYGRKGHRTIPSHVDEEVTVPMPRHCPGCGGRGEGDGWIDQYQTEIIRKAHVTRFRIQVGHCRECGRRLQGRHPRQSSDAHGAAASQLGPEAIALAAVLNKELGLSVGKTAAVLEKGFGLSVTRGGVCQALSRLGTRCEPTYDHLVESLQLEPSVTADETGWKVGGRLWWLWAFASDQLTVYAILNGRGYEEATRILNPDFDGFLVRDGWIVYRRFDAAFHQSCQAHIIRRCSEMEKSASSDGTLFPAAVKGLLQAGLDLRDRHDKGEVSAHGLAVATGKLEADLDRLLQQNHRLPEDQRLAKHLDREFSHLFTYLKCPGLEATNFRGEQAIRPAVVARKVWGGNRTPQGAHTQEILISTIRTSNQQHLDSIPMLAGLIRSQKPYVLDLFSSPAPPQEPQ
jgi:transposase